MKFFFTKELSHFVGQKIQKNIFSKNIFVKKYFFPILFFTEELSHFLGTKS
jgi:hypothetical protein